MGKEYVYVFPYLCTKHPQKDAPKLGPLLSSRNGGLGESLYCTPFYNC